MREELANNWAHIEAGWMRTVRHEFGLPGGVADESAGQTTAPADRRVYVSELSAMVSPIPLGGHVRGNKKAPGKAGRSKSRGRGWGKGRRSSWTLRQCRNVNSKTYIPPIPQRLQEARPPSVRRAGGAAHSPVPFKS